MAREIKFRAFWKAKGIMVTKKLNEQFWYTPDNKAINHSYGTDELFAKHELSEPMEITGLKDKNGKDVYEGDVVRLHCSSNEDQTVLATIEWDSESAGFIRHIHSKMVWHEIGQREVSMGEMHSWGGMHNCFAFPRYLEVVGNIYENPELLATPTTKQNNRQVKDR